jgi:hypothetical protein
MTNYPILRIPGFIENVNSEDIPVPKKPNALTEPIKGSKSAWNFLILLIPLLVIQLYLKVSGETVLFTGAIGLILIVFYSVKLSVEENSNHNKNLNIYSEELKKFQTTLAKHRKLVKTVRNSEYTRKFRTNRIKKEIFNTTLHWGENQNVNKGYSEDYFY